MERLEASLESALRLGLAEQAGHLFAALSGAAVERRQHDVAARYLEAGLAYCNERGLELFRALLARL